MADKDQCLIDLEGALKRANDLTELLEQGGRPVGGAAQGAAEKLTELIRTAKKVGTEQQALRHEELQARAGALADVFTRHPGEEGVGAALRELKGELPKAKFEAPEGFLNDIERSELFRDVNDYFITGRPSGKSAEELIADFERAVGTNAKGDSFLKRLGIDRTAAEEIARLRNGGDPEGAMRAMFSFTELNTKQALQNVLAGVLPRDFEIALLENVFGPEFSAALLAKRGLHERIGDEILALVGIPRVMKSTFDHSMLFRQNTLQALDPTKAKATARFASKSTRAMFSEKTADSLHDWMRSLPEYREAARNGVAFTSHKALSFPGREEPFMTAGERTFVGSALRSLLPPVKWSDRGASAVLNLQRMQLYNEWASAAKAAGTYTDDFGRQLAELANVLTGRGSLPRSIEKFNPILNQLFFSLRLQAARVKLPVTVLRGVDPAHRAAAKLAGGQMARWFVSGVTILGLIKASGLADVELDPRSAGFAKVKIGPTRTDYWGGFQPYVRFIARATTGAIPGVGNTKNALGEVTDVDVQGLTNDFIRSKYSPQLGIADDVRQGENIIGDPVGFEGEGLKNLASGLFVPLMVESVIEGWQEQQYLGMGLSMMELIGASVNSYTPDSVRIQSLIHEDIVQGKYNDVDDANIPNRRSDLSPADRQIFDSLHPEEKEASDEELAERAAEGDVTAVGFQQAQESAQRLHDDVADIARQYRSGSMTGDDFRQAVGRLRSDATAERQIVNGILQTAGFEQERPENPGVNQDLYDYGQIFNRFERANVDEAVRDDLFDALDNFRELIGPERERRLDANIGVGLNDIPEYRDLREAQKIRGDLPPRYQGVSEQLNDDLHDFDEGVDNWRTQQRLRFGEAPGMEDSIYEYAQEVNAPNAIVNLALDFRSDNTRRAAITNEYLKYLRDNRTTLAPFYPSLYPQYIIDIIGPPLRQNRRLLTPLEVA